MHSHLSVSKDQNANNSCFTWARMVSQTHEAMMTVIPVRSLQTWPSVIQPGLVGWHFEGSPHPWKSDALRTAAGPPWILFPTQLLGISLDSTLAAVCCRFKACTHCQASGPATAGAPGAGSNPLIRARHSLAALYLITFACLGDSCPVSWRLSSSVAEFHLVLAAAPTMAAAPGAAAVKTAKSCKKYQTVKRHASIYTYQEPPHR